MPREIKTDKNMLELNPHGNYGFPLHLIYITMSTYPFGQFNCHWHPELEIAYILDGSMTYQINQSQHHLTKGDFIFINSNALHSGCMKDNNDCRYVVATFNPTLIYGYEKSDIDTHYIFPLLNSENFSSFVSHEGDKINVKLKTLLTEIGDLYTEKDSCYELYIKSRLCELWSILFLEYKRCEETADTGLTEVKQISRLKNALTFIHSHYNESISLDEMAESCHTSKSEFCRIFKKTLHQTPFEYLLRYRIQKSLSLLATDSCSITEVADQVGFSGSSYYSEVFRKYMNCSPREYKKSLMN